MVCCVEDKWMIFLVLIFRCWPQPVTSLAVRKMMYINTSFPYWYGSIFNSMRTAKNLRGNIPFWINRMFRQNNLRSFDHQARTIPYFVWRLLWIKWFVKLETSLDVFVDICIIENLALPNTCVLSGCCLLHFKDKLLNGIFYFEPMFEDGALRSHTAVSILIVIKRYSDVYIFFRSSWFVFISFGRLFLSFHWKETCTSSRGKDREAFELRIYRIILM